MSSEQQKKIAYDLALEYMKQRQLLADVDSEIPKMSQRFGDVYEKFFNALTDVQNLQKLL